MDTYCPKCESNNVNQTGTSFIRLDAFKETFKCLDCGTTFQDVYIFFETFTEEI